MAKITSDSVSNFHESLELATLTKQGKPLHWPPVHHNQSGVEAPVQPMAGIRSAAIIAPGAFPAEGSEPSSPGTNSLTSDDKQDKSGSSVQETESSLQSPAPTAENPSSQDPASRTAPSSTAPSTSGSTPETGASQPDPSNSSEEALTPQPSETEATQPPSGRDLIHQARTAYEAHAWDEARGYLNEAWDADSELRPEIEVARQAIATAEANQQSSSEETPSAGGFLVQ